MAYPRANRPVPEEFFQDNPHRPLDPRQRVARENSSPVAFLAVVMIVLAVVMAGAYFAYRYNGGLATTAAEHNAAPPDIGTPVVRPSEPTGSAVRQ
jgi:hypothetical protein